MSRLFGHSSSSGGQRVKGETDCIEFFERKLLGAGLLGTDTIAQLHREANAEADEASAVVADEARPTAADVYRYTYAASEVDAVYPIDFTGLP